MANKQVEELTDASALTGDEWAHIVQGGNSRRVRTQAIADLASVGGAGDMLSSNNLSDVADVATARDNLGLGTAAVEDASAFDPAGTAAAAIATHEAAGDPHPGYVTTAEQSTALGSYLTTAAAASGYQPLDSDLTAIAALATTAYGRGLLELANQAALQSAVGVTQYTDEMAQDAVGGILTDSSTIDFTYNDGAGTITGSVIASAVKPTESLIVACSDETTAITTGTAKLTFRMPYAFTLSAVRASVTTAPTGSTIIIDINESGTTILSTKLSIDASEKTSITAASAAVISDTALADDAEITIDFDQVGSTIAGAGVKVYLIGTRA